MQIDFILCIDNYYNSVLYCVVKSSASINSPIIILPESTSIDMIKKWASS